MREIDNKLNNLNFKGVQKPAQEEKVQEENVTPVQIKEEQKEITDLKNMPAAELGKSQVTSADKIGNDIKFLTKHPEVAETINDAIDRYAQTHTEEETLKFIDAAIGEFSGAYKK